MSGHLGVLPGLSVPAVTGPCLPPVVLHDGGDRRKQGVGPVAVLTLPPATA